MIKLPNLGTSPSTIVIAFSKNKANLEDDEEINVQISFFSMAVVNSSELIT